MNASLFDQINAFARATPWLHGVITAYAAYGVHSAHVPYLRVGPARAA